MSEVSDLADILVAKIEAGAPDEAVGKLLLGLYIHAECSARGMPPGPINLELAKSITVAIQSAEANEARNSTVEKALHKAAGGDFAIAGRLIRHHVQDSALLMAALDEVVTGRRRQRKIARKDRGDALSRMIYELVDEKDGSLTESALLYELKHDGSGVVDEVTDEKIWFISADGTGQSAPVSGLRGRLFRAKKKFRETSSR